MYLEINNTLQCESLNHKYYSSNMVVQVCEDIADDILEHVNSNVQFQIKSVWK